MSFANTILKTALDRPLEDNPFLVSLKNGAYSQEGLKYLGVALLYMTQRFHRQLAKLLVHCPDIRFRRQIMENLLEEEGFVMSEKTGKLELVPHLNHVEMVKIFARKLVDIETNEEFDKIDWYDQMGDKLKSWSQDSQWIDSKLEDGLWYVAAASIVVGGEANVPRTFSLIISALKDQYGFNDNELHYFHEHVTVDVRHGADAAKALEISITDPKEREMVLEGVKRGASIWWIMLRRLDQEARRRMATASIK